jgi:TolB-like protein/Tfp pilus assembly protein PilF
MRELSSYLRFFAELKRRRVFRLMAVYGVIGFGILEAVDLAVPALLLPTWTYRFVGLLLLVGFPIAIVIGWAFELSPEGGIRRTRAAEDHELQRIARAPRSERWPIGIAAVVGSVLLLAGAWWVLGPGEAGRAVITLDPDEPLESIAVLPFVDLSPEGDQGYFGDGLAEELLDALARIDGLAVAARTSSFRFRDGDAEIPEVADRLGVESVLEGSVRSGGGRIRITAQLLNADGYHLWSESYDRSVSEMEDLIAVQEDIARSIVTALHLAPTSEDAEPVETLVAQGTDNLEAYDALLRGRHLMAQRSARSLAAAVEHFERATELDPAYALAWANLGMALNLQVGWGFHADDSVRTRATRAVDRALALDSMLAGAYTARGYATALLDLDYARADADFARALELDPRSALANKWRGEAMSDAGHPEEGLRFMRRARELDPLSPIVLTDLGAVLMTAGHYAEADSVFASVLELEPEYPPALLRLRHRSKLAGDLAATRAYGERYVAATDTTGTYILNHALDVGDGPLAVGRLRRHLPADSSPLPPDLRFDLVRVAFPLAEAEGDAAAAGFLDIQAARLRDVDPALATTLEGVGAVFRGDDAAAEAADRRLRSPSPGDDPHWQLRVYLAAARGDGPAAVGLIARHETIERWQIEWRFAIAHEDAWAGLRDDSTVGEFVAGLPAYVPLADFLDPRMDGE